MKLIYAFIFLIVSGAEAFSQDSLKTSPLIFYAKGRFNGYVFFQGGRIVDYNKDSSGNLDFTKPVHRFNPNIGINIGIHLFEFVYFRSTLFYKLSRDINVPWINSDYYYSIERTKWNFNSFSYGYENYQINKFKINKEGFFNNIYRGFFYLRYLNQFPRKALKLLRIDSSLNLTYTLTLAYALRYWDNESKTKGDVLHGKPLIKFNLKYIFLKNFYVEGTAIYYPIAKTKIISDPDFTYGFGYNQYRNLSLGFAYGNYSINRFPWNKKTIQNHGFLDGVFTLLFNYKF
jgi:hypothetical protein